MVKKIKELLGVGELVLTVGWTDTPGLVVGIVTETCGGVFAAEVVGFAVVDVEVETAGHSATTIPPLLTIPSSVCEFTVTCEHASCTSACIDNRFATHESEHPLLKSFFLQSDICVSYVKRHDKGIRVEVIS